MLARPLAQMLADPAEKCRELSCDLLSTAVASLPQPALLMPMVIPMLCQRLGASHMHETSEEVRLRLVRLLAAFTACAGSALEQHVADVTMLVCAALGDPVPDIKKVCTTLLLAAESQLQYEIDDSSDLHI